MHPVSQRARVSGSTDSSRYAVPIRAHAVLRESLRATPASSGAYSLPTPAHRAGAVPGRSGGGGRVRRAAGPGGRRPRTRPGRTRSRLRPGWCRRGGGVGGAGVEVHRQPPRRRTVAVGGFRCTERLGEPFAGREVRRPFRRAVGVGKQPLEHDRRDRRRARRCQNPPGIRWQYVRTCVRFYRKIVRPDEEVVDQGLGFDVATLMGRRQMLRALGLGAVAVGLAACGATGSAAPLDGRLGVDRDARLRPLGRDPGRDRRPVPGRRLQRARTCWSRAGSSAATSGPASAAPAARPRACPMTLELTITDLANGGMPFAGVAVYVWHCDREGGYSLYSDGVRTRTTCAACRSPTTTGGDASPASSPPATPGAGRTSTSRSTPTRPASPTRRTPSPPRRSRCRRTPASGVRPAGYEASVSNLAQVSLDERQRLRRRRRRRASSAP